MKTRKPKPMLRERAANAGVTRRIFLQSGALGGASLLAGRGSLSRAFAAGSSQRPNFLFISTDQQGLDTISAYGCRDVATPNMDRLVRNGVSFTESYSTNPLCSPARSSWFTGRMSSETGVIGNSRGIRPEIPNLGQWLSREGYETVYAGKWHLPSSFPPKIPGFTVIPTGISGQGNIGDSAVSRACEGYLRNRRGASPFFLVASLLQPHDICEWVSQHRNAADEIPYEGIAERLPALPANHDYDRREPAMVAKFRRPQWSERQWRYYLWSYYRHVEMADAEIGRILDALENSGLADNTIVFFTSDHGEGRARHHMVLKNYLYDEAAKVPMVWCASNRMRSNVQLAAPLVSGADIVPTVCDLAGVKAPRTAGRSLRPWLEGKNAEGREFVAAEVTRNGRMIRTPEFKYITYQGDPVEQLFDMRSDPGETKNLAGESKYASVLDAMRKHLTDWEAHLEVASPRA